jgi:glycosyltransferase involved in cell wall biosynthesis
MAFGVVAAQIGWGADDEPPVASAALEVERLIEDVAPDIVLLSNVFDLGVVRAARGADRAFVRLHDHRTFCPHGDRIYPQFRAPCSVAMGGACILNALVHGCVRGVHPETVRRLRAREHLAEAVRALDGAIVSSEFMAGLCVTNGIERERILITPPPVDPRSLATPPLPMPADRRLLFAARLIPDKGLRSLVRALARIAPPERPALDVAGAATPELEAVESLAAERGVVLNHLGRIGPAEMERAIDAVRAVAVPSLWPEPFGLLGIEAQARGRPAVAYAVGGVPEWIGSAGIAVPRGDEAALARAIVEVTDDERWKELAVRARQQAARYAPPAHAARILEFCFPPR